MLLANSLIAQRVYIEDNLFKINGQAVYLNGANTPWDNWNDLGQNFDYNWWNTHFKALHEAGINSTRVWLSCDSNHKGIEMGEDGKMIGPSEQFWIDMDSLLAIAAKHQVYIMGALISFDHFKGSNSNYDSWIKLFSSKENMDAFAENYAVPLVQRYKDNPYLFSIDVCNEILWISESESSSPDRVPWKDLQYFIGKVAQRIHETSDVLVCASNYIKYVSSNYDGNKYSDQNLIQQAGDEDAYLDFYKIHYYTWVSRWFSGFHPMRTPAYYALQDKPCITGEMPANEIYAYNRSLGSDTWLMDVKDAYEIAYQNGWQGSMSWTSNGVDDYGNLDNNLAEATIAFRDQHFDLVYPDTASEYLSINNNVIEITDLDTLISFNLSSNIPWTVHSEESWVETTAVQGEGDSVLVLKVLQNETGEARSAHIEISSSLGIKTLTLNQVFIIPPVANAGEDFSLPDLQADGIETVNLDGSLSTDEDGEIHKYTWQTGGKVVATGVSPALNLTTGTHEIVLTVADNFGKTSQDTVIIDIIEQILPLAVAGEDISVRDTLGDGMETIRLDASQSSDEDGQILAYSWQLNNVEIADTIVAEVELPLGVHEIILIVTDDIGNYAMDTIIVEIIDISLAIIQSSFQNRTIDIYPNPFSDAFTVTFTQEEEGRINIQLIESTGRSSMTLTDQYYSPGDYTFHLDGSSMTPGIYYLKIRNRGALQKIYPLVKL